MIIEGYGVGGGEKKGGRGRKQGKTYGKKEKEKEGDRGGEEERKRGLNGERGNRKVVQTKGGVWEIGKERRGREEGRKQFMTYKTDTQILLAQNKNPSLQYKIFNYF